MKFNLNTKLFVLTILAFSFQIASSQNVHAKRVNKQVTSNKSSLLKVSNAATKQEFTFIGSPGEEESFKQVTKVLIDSQEAWNKHQIEDLLKYYSPNFLSKDGMNLSKIRSNLNDFWLQYTDAKIDSLPAIINVAGDYATVSLTEITTATGQVEDGAAIPYPPKFKAIIRGITTLKKTGSNWKISSEEILSEEMWKSYGSPIQGLLDEGKIKLVIPSPVKQGENYIAQLQYSLPDKIQGVALVDKILLTEFPDSKSEASDDSKLDKAKLKEIEAIRRNIEGSSEEGLRRLFTANNLGQDELVRAQIELVSFQGASPTLYGVVGLSQRVVPKLDPKEDKNNGAALVTQTLKEESLNPKKAELVVRGASAKK